MATIKDLKRMCKNMTCKDCPLNNEKDNDCLVCLMPSRYPDEDIDAIVDKWMSEHPIKTYLQDFFEKFPNAPRGAEGSPKICPHQIYPEIAADDRCPEDCLKCWTQEMKKE